MILLDTCVLFWLELGPERISPKAREAMLAQGAQLFASAVSAFELGLKVRAGEITLPMPTGKWVREVCERRGIRVLPLDEEAAGFSATLPMLHRDPCDRFLIATAQLAGLALVTPDDKIRLYPNLKVIW
jgi:PIN domain nuclease of toxin-antitoxin system